MRSAMLLLLMSKCTNLFRLDKTTNMMLLQENITQIGNTM